MLQVITAILILFVLPIHGCTRALPEKEATQILIGEYRLIIPENQMYAEKDVLFSKLVLSADNTFLLECVYRGKKSKSIVSKWRYDDGHVQFDEFSDCAGVWPSKAANYGAASLIVKFTSPPIILLSPDTGIYYEKQVN